MKLDPNLYPVEPELELYIVKDSECARDLCRLNWTRLDRPVIYWSSLWILLLGPISTAFRWMRLVRTLWTPNSLFNISPGPLIPVSNLLISLLT